MDDESLEENSALTGKLKHQTYQKQKEYGTILPKLKSKAPRITEIDEVEERTVEYQRESFDQSVKKSKELLAKLHFSPERPDPSESPLTQRMPKKKIPVPKKSSKGNGMSYEEYMTQGKAGSIK